MPYIKQTDRTALNPSIDRLVADLKNLHTENPSATAGNLNYTITAILSSLYCDDVRYGKINEVIGMLECCKLEFYRRVAAPYETQKAFENGDVFPPIV